MILMVAIIDQFSLILCKLIAASIYSLKKVAVLIRCQFSLLCLLPLSPSLFLVGFLIF